MSHFGVQRVYYIMSILNISAYRFVLLSDLPDLQRQLQDFLCAYSLKRTVVLSPEGINIMLAGEKNEIVAFKKFLASVPPFKNMDYKSSLSDKIPFNKMLVKIKKMLTPLAGLAALHGQERYLSAQQLKQWLDADKEFILLDTRNQYEIAYGAFDKATPLKLQHFNECATALDNLPEEMKTKTLVTYCTGGIRCEKIFQ